MWIRVLDDSLLRAEGARTSGGTNALGFLRKRTVLMFRHSTVTADAVYAIIW